MPLIKVLNYAIRGYRSKAAKGSLNSGISKRLNIIKENHPDIENVEVTEESFDNLEGGIAMLNKRVEKDYRVAEFKKIERKFFKQEAYPNLLTWSEKEQIRFLYNTDPTTWSPEKLSECFPATADIIKKLVKSQWKPMNSQRILHHDNAVKENWKAFENGLLKLPHFLSTHIKNFVSRGKILNLPSEDKSLQTYNPPSASSEFLDIVRNFKEKDNNSRTNECPIVNNPSPYHKEETYVLKQKAPIRLKHKYYTLNQLKKELSHRVSSGSEIVLKNKDDDAKGIQPKVDSELLPKPSNVLNTTISNKEFKTAVISEHIEEIPLKITIPKEKIVKDKTHLYKVKDCFYDNNGEFVYRVPGMGN